MTHQSDRDVVSSHEHAPDEYLAHVKELRDILNNEPPSKPDYTVTDYPRRYSSDGRIYTVTRKRRYRGTPEFRLLAGDLHDSYWFYRLISETIVGFPVGVTEATSHTEYFHANKRRLGLE